MNEATWAARVALVRAQIAPAALAEGTWVGEGIAHGEPITGELRVRRVLGASMVEVWEKVGDHEDVCFYRYDADFRQLKVLHLMDGATVAEHPVEVAGDSLVWVTPPEQPAVEWRIEGAALRCEVIWPGQKQPEVSMRYTRAPG